MGLRWNMNTGYEESNPAIDAFIAEITAVCEKHNLSIAHEDGHGAFIIENFDLFNIDSLSNAMDNVK